MQSEEIPLDQVPTMENLAAQMEARALRARRRRRRAARHPRPRARVRRATTRFYDEDDTQRATNRARAEVDPVTEKLTRGQVLVRRGDLVTRPRGAEDPRSRRHTRRPWT